MSISATTSSPDQLTTLFDIKHSDDRESKLINIFKQIAVDNQLGSECTPEKMKIASDNVFKEIDSCHDDVLQAIPVRDFFNSTDTCDLLLNFRFSHLSDDKFLKGLNTLLPHNLSTTRMVLKRLRVIKKNHPERLPKAKSMTNRDFMSKLALNNLKLGDLWGISDERAIDELNMHEFGGTGRNAGALLLLSSEQKKAIRNPKIFNILMCWDLKGTMREYLFDMDSTFLNEQIPKLYIDTLLRLPLKIFSTIDLSLFEVEKLERLLQELERMQTPEEHLQVIRDQLSRS